MSDPHVETVETVEGRALGELRRALIARSVISDNDIAAERLTAAEGRTLREP